MRTAALVLVGCLTGIAGCSGCSPNSATSTGDAGTQDAGGGLSRRDANAPDRADAGDASDASSQSDAATPTSPFTGTWDPLPGRHADCTTRLARDPATQIPRLTWSACRSGRAGCRLLASDWSPDVGRSIGFRDFETMIERDGKPLLTYTRIFRRNPKMYAFMVVVQDPDGDAVFAAGDDIDPVNGTCTLDVAAGPYGISFQTVTMPAEAPRRFRFAWAPWTNLRAFSVHGFDAAELGLAVGSSVQYQALGAANLFLETKDPDSITTIELATAKSTVVASPTRVAAEAPIAVSDGALAISLTSPSTLAYVRADGSWSRVVTPTPPYGVSSYRIDRANQDALVWAESELNGVYVSSTIWTAPFTTSEAPLQKRKVARLDDKLGQGGGEMVVNGGFALNVVDTNKALLTRLSDGRGWVVASEPGLSFVRAVWIDSTDVWISTAEEGIGYRQSESGVLRISTSSLGEPTVDP